MQPREPAADRSATPTHASLRDRRNFVELPYRGVSVQPYHGAMTETAIAVHLMGRETYRRTNAIVLRGADGAYALVAVGPRDVEPLFAPIDHVEVLALPENCRFVVDPETDCANPSALARVAERSGVDPERTLICQGKFDHVNFIHRPDPLVRSLPLGRPRRSQRAGPLPRRASGQARGLGDDRLRAQLAIPSSLLRR